MDQCNRYYQNLYPLLSSTSRISMHTPLLDSTLNFTYIHLLAIILAKNRNILHRETRNSTYRLGMGCTSSKPARVHGRNISNPKNTSHHHTATTLDARSRAAAKYNRTPPPPPPRQPYYRKKQAPIKRKPVAPPSKSQVAYYSARPLPPKPQKSHKPMYVKARQSKHGSIYMQSDRGTWKRAKDC